jgi:hypothetical protein
VDLHSWSGLLTDSRVRSGSTTPEGANTRFYSESVPTDCPPGTRHQATCWSAAGVPRPMCPFTPTLPSRLPRAYGNFLVAAQPPAQCQDVRAIPQPHGPHEPQPFVELGWLRALCPHPQRLEPSRCSQHNGLHQTATDPEPAAGAQHGESHPLVGQPPPTPVADPTAPGAAGRAVGCHWLYVGPQKPFGARWNTLNTL